MRTKARRRRVKDGFPARPDTDANGIRRNIFT
jgi:hypothetical protein